MPDGFKVGPSTVGPTIIQQAQGVMIGHGSFVQAGHTATLIHNYYHHPCPHVNSNIAAALRHVPNLRKIHLDALSKATPGTVLWFLRTETFILWLDLSGTLKILWGTGIPGAGKTVMASIVINDLDARAAASGGRICVAYIYFRYSDSSTLTIRSILEILVKQTVERHQDCASLQRTPMLDICTRGRSLLKWTCFGC